MQRLYEPTADFVAAYPGHVGLPAFEARKPEPKSFSGMNPLEYFGAEAVGGYVAQRHPDLVSTRPPQPGLEDDRHPRDLPRRALRLEVRLACHRATP